MALERARVLDRSECARALAGVLELRHLWIQRVNVAPFNNIVPATIVGFGGGITLDTAKAIANTG